MIQKLKFKTNSYKNSVKSHDFTEFLVRPTRFERATYRVGVCHSIQLSYGRVLTGNYYSRDKWKSKGKTAGWDACFGAGIDKIIFYTIH